MPDASDRAGRPWTERAPIPARAILSSLFAASPYDHDGRAPGIPFGICSAPWADRLHSGSVRANGTLTDPAPSQAKQSQAKQSHAKPSQAMTRFTGDPCRDLLSLAFFTSLVIGTLFL